jgi:hypothetical protein
MPTVKFSAAISRPKLQWHLLVPVHIWMGDSYAAGIRAVLHILFSWFEDIKFLIMATNSCEHIMRHMP